jgi:polygalacturonase
VNRSRRALVVRAAALTVPWLVSSPIRAWSRPVPRNIREHGARGDGKTKDTRAIQAAIDAAAASGSVVLVPPGEYLAGTLRLRERTTLWLAAGATLVASRDDADFGPPETLDYEPFADRETTDFSFALLQGRGLQHVTIAGPGRIDGNRGRRGGPKPIALKQCRHVAIRDVTIDGAPNYAVSLLGCDHVDIRGVRIVNGYADGIDPDCCRHVRITGCRVESRDDAIVVKASLALGARRSTENVVVTDCDLVNVRNGLKIGTESSGDVRNVVFRNCRLSGRAEPWRPPPRDWKPLPSAGVSIQNVDGGRLERVVVSGLTMVGVRAPIFIRLAERGRGQDPPAAGTLSRVVVSDVVATGATWASSIMGVPGRDVADVSVANIRISARGGGAAELVSREVPEREREYPDAARTGDLPAHGLYCRHVTRLRLEHAAFTLDHPDARPAVILDDVREARLTSVVAPPASPAGPMVWLRSVRECLLTGLRTRPDGAPLVRLSGADTARIRVVRSGSRRGEPTTLLDAEVDAAALRHEDGAVGDNRG